MDDPQSVAGAVFSPSQKEVLLIQRRDVPVWVLPGGGIEKGESPEEAVLREIFEETGFHVKICALAGVYLPMNRLAKRTHLYRCEVVGGALQTSEESRDVRFFPLEKLPKHLPPPYPDWIREALSLQPPVMKPLTQVNYPTLFKYFFTHPLLVSRFLLTKIGITINSK